MTVHARVHRDKTVCFEQDRGLLRNGFAAQNGTVTGTPVGLWSTSGQSIAMGIPQLHYQQVQQALMHSSSVPSFGEAPIQAPTHYTRTQRCALHVNSPV